MLDHTQTIAALTLAIETLREQLIRERDRADRAERLLAERSNSLSLYKESEREEERECVQVAARASEDLPELWREAALTERRRADLPDVDLESEWRKLILYDDGKQIRLCRWLKWARGARLDHTNQPRIEQPAELTVAAETSAAMPRVGSDAEQAKAYSWAKTGKWAPRGMEASWGPAPDQPGCQLPSALVAWAKGART